MILFIMGIVGLFVAVALMLPGRRAWVFCALLLCAGLFGGLILVSNLYGDRAQSSFEQTSYELLPMGAAESEVYGLGERVEVSRSRIGDLETIAYVYGGRYTLIFQSGKLVSKSRR